MAKIWQTSTPRRGCGGPPVEFANGLFGILLADDLAGRSDDNPELPIPIAKGQTKATFVLTDPALAEAVDDAAAHLGHELLNRQFEAPRDHRRVDLDGLLCRVDSSSHADMFLFSRKIVAYRYYIDRLLAE